MKRFYCKTCHKIVRVRTFPANIDNEFAAKPSDRVGECAWHTRSEPTHKAWVRVSRVPVPAGVKPAWKPKKVLTFSKPKGKSKSQSRVDDDLRLLEAEANGTL